MPLHMPHEVSTADGVAPKISRRKLETPPSGHRHRRRTRRWERRVSVRRTRRHTFSVPLRLITSTFLTHTSVFGHVGICVIRTGRHSHVSDTSAFGHIGIQAHAATLVFGHIAGGGKSI
jgi:hypothetical protein